MCGERSRCIKIGDYSIVFYRNLIKNVLMLSYKVPGANISGNILHCAEEPLIPQDRVTPLPVKGWDTDLSTSVWIEGVDQGIDVFR